MIGFSRTHKNGQFGPLELDEVVLKFYIRKYENRIEEINQQLFAVLKGLMGGKS